MLWTSCEAQMMSNWCSKPGVESDNEDDTLWVECNEASLY